MDRGLRSPVGNSPRSAVGGFKLSGGILFISPAASLDFEPGSVLGSRAMPLSLLLRIAADLHFLFRSEVSKACIYGCVFLSHPQFSIARPLLVRFHS